MAVVSAARGFAHFLFGVRLSMKIWFNKVHEAKRVLIESDSPEIRIGRDPSNTIVLQSPLVSKRHAVVTRENGKLKLENVGVNGCLVAGARLH